MFSQEHSEQLAAMVSEGLAGLSATAEMWCVHANERLWDLRDSLNQRGVPTGILREEYAQWEALMIALTMLLLPLGFAMTAVHCLKPTPKRRLKKQLSIQNIDRSVADVWSPGKELEAKKEELVERMSRASARARAALKTKADVDQTPRTTTRGVRASLLIRS
jgi:hypothetical protein